MKNFVITELNKRKGEWETIHKVTGISTKTIGRIAHDTVDPRYSNIEKLFLLFKHNE
jgi:predicted transcriptional regulator